MSIRLVLWGMVTGLLLVAQLLPGKEPFNLPREQLKKPAWISDLSVGFAESYDSNLYRTDVNGPVGNSIANRSSFLSTVSARLGVDFIPLLNPEGQGVFKTLNFAYLPDAVIYDSASSEDHIDHRFETIVKMKEGAFSLEMDNQFAYIDGSNQTPQYTSRSSYATAEVRTRREQLQDKGKLALRYTAGSWFFRPTAALIYYDYRTEIKRAVGPYLGWQNYADRYDINGGADVGYQVLPDFYLTLGYRYGHQEQAAFYFSPVNSSNDYNRMLIGFEGRPLPWLKAELQIGPDFRDFGSDVAPGHAEKPVRLFYETLLSADLSSVDSLVLKGKQWEWVSGTGMSSYEDMSWSLSYKRKLGEGLTVSVGGLVGNAVYDTPATPNDWLFSFTTGLKYELNPHLEFVADYAFTRGESGSSNPADDGRDFDLHMVSLGLRASF